MKYIETKATEGHNVEEAFKIMVEQQEKAAASGGGLDMPMSLGAATGAVTITAAGDQRATETQQAKKKKKGCC
jgi:hypothetical protein